VTLAEIALAIGKILVIILFPLLVAPLLIWADRRQSAMIQHRIGPNRAGFELPSMIVRGILFAPALAAGVGAVVALGPTGNVRAQLERTLIATELAILVAWLFLTFLAWRVHLNGAVNKVEELVGSLQPRTYFFFGLAAHAAAIAFIRVIPPDAAVTRQTNLVATTALGVFIVGSAGYAALSIPGGKIGIRLAGTIHSAADALKLFFKEDFIPKNADRLLHSIAPMIAIFPSFVIMAVVPFGDTLCVGDPNKNGILEFSDLLSIMPSMTRDGICAGHAIPLQVADLNVGILYLFAISSTGVIGAALAGWSSDNKFSLMGGLRAASQMVSYEVAMGLSLMGVFIIAGSLRLGPIVGWQQEHAWGIFVQPLAFFLFLAASCAETKRVPFDQPEGESEIVAGYFLEYSGMKFGMFMAGEYIELVGSSALLVTLFFGGYSLPFLHQDGITVTMGETILFAFKMNHVAVIVLSVVAFFGKTIVMIFVQVFFRWTLPRFRYDQLMKFGWTKLLPLSIANMFVTALVCVLVDSSPKGFTGALSALADVTNFIVVAGMVAAPVFIIATMLKPTAHQKFTIPSAARFAAEAGGTKPTPMQA
jgi:NADH-quinone oxidoreductase subunit H